MRFRPLLPLLLTGALVACSTTVVSPSEGTGASSSTGSGTATSSGSSGVVTGTSTGGTGTPGPSQYHSDHGACGLTDAATPLATTTIYNGNLNYTQALWNVISFSTDQVWSGVITDQVTYQPFQDSGLPAVDFSFNALIVTAATNGCNGNAAPSDISISEIDNAAHLEVTYSLLSALPSDGSGYCPCEYLSHYSILAVQVPILPATPMVCMHEVTGC